MNIFDGMKFALWLEAKRLEAEKESETAWADEAAAFHDGREETFREVAEHFNKVIMKIRENDI